MASHHVSGRRANGNAVRRTAPLAEGDPLPPDERAGPAPAPGSTPDEDAEGDVWLEVEGQDGRTANLNLGQPHEGLAAAALGASALNEKAHA